MKKIYLILFMCLFLTGCNNYHELSDIAIVTGIGFDKTNDIYNVSLMIANASDMQKSNKDGDSSTTVICGEGKTISEAIKDAERVIPKDIYLGHVNVAIINENIAKDSIYPIIEYLVRNPESVKKLYLIISKNTTSQNVLETLSPLESFPAESIVTNLRNAKTNLGTVSDILVSTFISNTLKEGSNNVLPTITLIGNVNDANNSDDLKNTNVKTELVLDSLAIFNNYKLVDYANSDISKGINILNNKINNLEISIPCYKDIDKYIVIKLDNIKTNIMYKNNFFININSNGSINETNCDLNLIDNKTIIDINNSVNSYVYDLIYDTMKYLTSNKNDVINFGNIVYKNNPKYYKNIDNWNMYFSNIKYDIKINTNIKTKGSLKTTIKDMQYEKN